MGLQESMDLSIQAALAKVKQLDKAISKSLDASVDLDTKVATAKIAKLRQAATDAFRRSVEFNLNTNEARIKLVKLDTQVKAVRKLIGTPIEFSLGTSEAEAKLLSLHRAARAVRNQASAATNVAQGKPANGRFPTSEPVQAQRSLNSALTRYNAIAPVSITLGGQFADILRNQAIAAGLLAGEMRTITASMQAFNAASRVRPPILGPGRAELNQVLKEEREWAKRQAAEAAAAAGPPLPRPAGAAAEAERTRVALKALGRDAQSINQQMVAAGRSLSLAFTLPAVGLAALAAFQEFNFQDTIQRTKVLTDAFVDLNAAGEKVALTGAAVGERIEALRSAFNDIGALTGQTPQAIAEGFYFVASAGVEAANRLSVLRVAAEGAAIGLGTVEVVADALTSVLNAYADTNITAAEAGDILVQAVNDAKVEAADFAPQLGRVLPIAHELGVEFSGVASALATLTKNGNSAQVASTQLRGVLQSLLRPSSNAAASLLNSIGLNPEAIEEQLRTGGPAALIDVLGRLRYDSGLTTTELSQLFRRVDGFIGFLTLTDQLQAARSAMIGVAEAGKNTSGSLDEFERFAEENRVLELRSAFSQLLAQLQPLGIKVLPAIADGLQLVVGGVDALASGFNKLPDPVKKIGLLGVGILALAGPLLIVGGRIRQITSLLDKFQAAASFKGGLGVVLRGGGLRDAEENARALGRGVEGATDKVAKMGTAIGVARGAFGLAAAAGGAFVSGLAFGSEGIENKLLGVAGAVTSVTFALGAARSIATALGTTLGPIGAAFAVLSVAIPFFVGKSAAATDQAVEGVEELKSSLKGLTQEESIRKFASDFEESFKKITSTDTVTELEFPELEKQLKGLKGYEEVARDIANTVAVADGNGAQLTRMIRGLAQSLVEVDPTSLNELEDGLKGINEFLTTFPTKDIVLLEHDDLYEVADGAQLLGEDLAELLGNMEGLSGVSDSTRARLQELADQGLVSGTVIDGSLTLSLNRAGAEAGLTKFEVDELTKALLPAAAAMEESRKAAFAATGQWVAGKNAAGEFVEKLDDEGDTILGFAADTDTATLSVAKLNDELTRMIDETFGRLQVISTGEFQDNAVKVAQDLFTEGGKVTQEFVIDPETGKPKKTEDKKDGDAAERNPDFINFKVGLEGPDGQPARDYIRGKVDDIDENIQGYLDSNPNADIGLALSLRDDNLEVLAASVGLTVEELNRFLAGEGADGASTLQLQAQLNAAGVGNAQLALQQTQTLLDSLPLDIKTTISMLPEDQQAATAAGLLLEKAVTGGSSEVIDFVVNAQLEGIPLSIIEQLFADAPVDYVQQFILQSIEEGTPIEDIAKTLAAFPPETISQLTFTTSFENTPAEGDPGFALWDRFTGNQVSIKAVLDGADEVRADLEAIEQEPVEVSMDVDDEEIVNLRGDFAEGDTWYIYPEIDDVALKTMVATLSAGLKVSIIPVAGGPIRPGQIGYEKGERGGLWSGGGFRRFALGGMTDGSSLPRTPMIGRAPRGSKGILWGEPGTHKESYIPHNPIHRVGAVAVLRKTADQFGMELHDKVKGAVRMAARGAYVDMPSSYASATGGGGGGLAREVANLAAVVASRETVPLIGELHNHRQVGNDMAMAKYLASDMNAAAARGGG